MRIEFKYFRKNPLFWHFYPFIVFGVEQEVENFSNFHRLEARQTLKMNTQFFSFQGILLTVGGHALFGPGFVWGLRWWVRVARVFGWSWSGVGFDVYL